MLVRIIIENLLSFGERREFNMLPAPRKQQKPLHKLKAENTEVLKLSALYGANASGKSNLVKAVDFLKDLILDDDFKLNDILRYRFKASKKLLSSQPILLAIEFAVEQKLFSYAIQITEKRIQSEELYRTGEEEYLLFERETDNKGVTKTNFQTAFEEDSEGRILKGIIEKNLSKINRPLFKQLTELDNPFFSEITLALSWFENILEIITPDAYPVMLPYGLDKNEEFRKYVNKIFSSFDTGIVAVEVARLNAKEVGIHNKLPKLVSVIEEMEDEEEGDIRIFSPNVRRKELILEKEDGEVVIKAPMFSHKGFDKDEALFTIYEQSDGTIRLLDYMPLFYNLLKNEKVYLVDEIERSIHPLLIKTLIKKFSDSEHTKGQLIFTTHEAQLLDQEIFRQDEIWFLEKDPKGCTDLYPLSEFKEHHTKNIRNGYLSGRYGAIPFMGDLKTLKWEDYATD